MHERRRLTVAERIRLATRIWLRFVRVTIAVRREPLPEYVARLARAEPRPSAARRPARTLSRAVDRSLRIGNRRPRCLLNALVLFRLLREQGDEAVLVIGLPVQAADERAHAWVELAGRDVGPPPGSAGHRELARLP